jgi:hypothetical protein
MEEDDDLPASPAGEPEGTPPFVTGQVMRPEERWMVKRDLIGHHAELEIVRRMGHGALRGHRSGGRPPCARALCAVAADVTSVGAGSTWTVRSGGTTGT